MNGMDVQVAYLWINDRKIPRLGFRRYDEVPASAELNTDLEARRACVTSTLAC